MTRLLTIMAACGLLLSSVGCCCLSGGGYGACYPPAGGPCPGGACGIGALPGPGVAQAISPNAVTTTASGPVAIGPTIVPGQVTYHVPTTTTTWVTTPYTTTATLQPLPTY